MNNIRRSNIYVTRVPKRRRMRLVQKIFEVRMMKILPTCEGNKFINSVSLKRIFVVQSLSRIRLFMTPWIAAHQDSLSFSSSWCLLKLMSIELMMPSNQLILSCPLFLLLSSFPSIRVFSSESTLHQVARVLELQLQSFQ